MALKAVLFDFNGVILNDESIHQALLEDILISENLRPRPNEYWDCCLGRSDRACLETLLKNQGRFVTDAQLDTLVSKKALAYQAQLAALPELPLFPGLETLLTQLQTVPLTLAIVSGALRQEITGVLQQAGLTDYFKLVVAAEDVAHSKPAPDGYQAALAQLGYQPEECLAIEDTYNGLESAKQAGISAMGVAHTHPFHMLQRRANWVIDSLTDLDLDYVLQVFDQDTPSLTPNS